jgi:hypothetical protein
MRVKCLDNSLHSDQLTVGRYYELESVEHNNFRLVGIQGLFHYRRFATLPIVHVDVKEIHLSEPIPEISDASFPEPIRRYRGRDH